MSGLFSGIGMRTVWDLRSSRVRWGAVLGFVVALLLPSVALALPNFTIAPTTLNFGNVAVGATSDLVVTVTNVSGASQTLSSLAGGAPADGVNFGAVQNCAGITLAAGASCVFTYTFHPTSTGTKTTTTSFSVNGQSSGTINLNGVGIPAFTAAPTSLDFGVVTVGGTSSGIDVVVTNVSGASQVLSSVAGGAPADAANFGAVQNCAGITLAAGASCAFTYVFHPTTAGLLTSSTSFSINGQAFSISLRGGVPVVAPAGVTSVPTLGQWSLMLLSLLGAAMGALVVGRGRAGVRMADGAGERIRGIRSGRSRQLEQALDHLLDLSLVGLAVADHRLLDLQRRVFGHRQVPRHRTADHRAAGLAEQQRRFRIDVHEDDLDRGDGR